MSGGQQIDFFCTCMIILLCGIKIVCSFLKLSCAWCMHRQRGKDCHTNLDFSFLIIYIIFPLYRRKFCDGRSILVFHLKKIISIVIIIFKKIKFFTTIISSKFDMLIFICWIKCKMVWCFDCRTKAYYLREEPDLKGEVPSVSRLSEES